MLHLLSTNMRLCVVIPHQSPFLQEQVISSREEALLEHQSRMETASRCSRAHRYDRRQKQLNTGRRFIYSRLIIVLSPCFVRELLLGNEEAKHLSSLEAVL